MIQKIETPEDVRDRIALMIKVFAKNPNAFSAELGVPNTQIYNIIKGKRNKPSFDLLVKILETFPQIRVEWLVMGRGKMVYEGETRGVYVKGTFNFFLEEKSVPYQKSRNKRLHLRKNAS